MSPAHDLVAARRSHVLEYLATHPEGASAREIHAAAVESGEAAALDWDRRFAAGPLVVLAALHQAGEVALVHERIQPPPALDQRYVIAQLALL